MVVDWVRPVRLRLIPPPTIYIVATILSNVWTHFITRGIMHWKCPKYAHVYPFNQKRTICYSFRFRQKDNMVIVQLLSIGVAAAGGSPHVRYSCKHDIQREEETNRRRCGLIWCAKEQEASSYLDVVNTEYSFVKKKTNHN